MDIKVGFITPDNETFMMNYDEVREFCKNVCLSEKYVLDFNEFSKNYKYFEAYFDFIMIKLNYIFINPLLEEDTYLKNVSNKYYRVLKDEIEGIVDYNSITDLAIRLKNGGNYSHIVPSSDKELNIKLIDPDNICTCMVDPNGYTMISTSDEEKGNHEITSNTIINQLLINNKSLWRQYNFERYSISYLIEKFGFIRATSLEYNGLMAGIDKFLTPIQRTYCDLCVEKGCTFLNLETKRDFDIEEKISYEIGGKYGR